MNSLSKTLMTGLLGAAMSLSWSGSAFAFNNVGSGVGAGTGTIKVKHNDCPNIIEEDITTTLTLVYPDPVTEPYIGFWEYETAFTTPGGIEFAIIDGIQVEKIPGQKAIPAMGDVLAFELQLNAVVELNCGGIDPLVFGTTEWNTVVSEFNKKKTMWKSTLKAITRAFISGKERNVKTNMFFKTTFTPAP